MITGNQLRAARALLDWTQDDLAATAGVTERTVRSCEEGGRQPYARTIARLRGALESAGIEFIESETGVGVLLTRNSHSSG